MQSAFRVSKSAIFEQTSPASLGKRPIDHIPQAVMDSIEGLVDPGKLVIAEARKLQHCQDVPAFTRNDFIRNIENIHPNLTVAFKASARQPIYDALKPRVPMGVLDFEEEAPT